MTPYTNFTSSETPPEDHLLYPFFIKMLQVMADQSGKNPKKAHKAKELYERRHQAFVKMENDLNWMKKELEGK